MDRAYPETSVFYRHLGARFPEIVRAEGCWLHAADGRSWLDGCGGAFVVNVGHGVTEIADAMARQARTLGYANGTQFTHPAVEELAAELAALAPGDLDRVYPLSSGSDAIEAALKLARQYWLEQGRHGKHRIVALAPAYHGNTLLALSASAREHYRAPFADWLVDVVRVPAPYSYRCACGGRAPLCATCSGDALEETILREDPATIAALVIEPVGGSSSGATVPAAEWLRRARALCDAHDILLVADEILVGAGRTGSWSALEPSGVVPDVQVLGKGIAGGYAPLSALVAPKRITDVIARGSGALHHAQTFSHHPVLCAAGVATLRYLREHDLVARCERMSPVLFGALDGLRELPVVGDVRGRGLLAAVELVADRATRAPLSRAARLAERVAAAAMDAGLVVWPGVGNADGHDGDLVMIAPPFVITPEEIGELVSRLRRAIERATRDVRGARPAAGPPPRAIDMHHEEERTWRRR